MAHPYSNQDRPSWRQALETNAALQGLPREVRGETTPVVDEHAA